MTQEQAYIEGFVKRASEYGVHESQAIELLKTSGALDRLGALAKSQALSRFVTPIQEARQGAATQMKALRNKVRSMENPRNYFTDMNEWRNYVTGGNGPADIMNSTQLSAQDKIKSLMSHRLSSDPAKKRLRSLIENPPDAKDLLQQLHNERNLGAVHTMEDLIPNSGKLSEKLIKNLKV
jgi:hypothetical protein